MSKNFEFFTDVIKHQAKHLPEEIAFQFQEERITYLDLWQSTVQYALQLHNNGILPNEQVLIALPNGLEFFLFFFACQLIGAIPVPLAPSSGIQRIQMIGILAEASHLICSEDNLFSENKTLASLKIHSIETFVLSETPTTTPDFKPNKIAFIQFTSGTTGVPKGAIITHQNLLTNIQQMIAGMEIGQTDIFVSWLPVYHDMGLILMTLTPLYLGAISHLLPTKLSNLSTWLNTIQKERATFIAAPDFAYRMLFRYIRNPEAHDLSSLRVALNAAEPVRAETIKKFHAAFNLENVMVAGYGLAEATVGVSMWKPKTKNKIDNRFVSVGRPFPEIDIKIVIDGKKEAKPREYGEIMIKSPANIAHYFHQENDNEALFWETDYVRSGDIGYLDEEGFLYIADRKKNVIKHIGRTIAPKEIEEAVEHFATLRHVVALGIDNDGIEGEQIVVFGEMRKVRLQREAFYQNLVIEMVQAIYEHIGVRPASIVFLKPGAVPKTHNGKTQYLALKALFLSGELGIQNHILFKS